MSLWIDFDIKKVRALREDFLGSLAFIRQELPPNVNWNSPKQIKAFFKKRYDITLENVKISTLEAHLEGLEHTCELQDTVTGLMQYMKLKAVVQNYLDNILKHHENGRYHLREKNGIWLMQNKQPVPRSEEVLGCVKRMHPDVAQAIGSSQSASW